jgi:hypothetical protein
MFELWKFKKKTKKMFEYDDVDNLTSGMLVKFYEYVDSINDLIDYDINEDEISLLVEYLKIKKNSRIFDFIIDSLLVNRSFLTNQKVKDTFGKNVYNFIMNELEIYNLTEDKGKIIDLFHKGDFDSVEKMVNNLNIEDKKDIFKYILDQSNEESISVNGSKIHDFLKKYEDILKVM